ncbi:MAG: hypothetical protein RAO94_10080 [Candidatus Stygibacter australis]|nr:hypothetical protein [Candidatus Stygibacter australis]MDP8322685.1 hypothetical protein [Candidatus Stygibacter australis]
MKRRIVITCLFLISISFLMSEMNFGVGLDLPGTHELSGTDYSTDFDTAIGFQVFGEYLKPLSKSPGMNLDGGIGVAYLFLRNPDHNDEGDQAFGFIPLYVLGQVSTIGEGTVFFGKLRAGYDIFYGNADYFPERDFSGGFFLGIGGGIIMTNNLFLELSYQMLKGSMEEGSTEDEEGFTEDVSDSHLSILIGLKMK